VENKKQISNRHHYVPEFYLRNWHHNDGKGVWRYVRNKVNTISSRRLPAKSICYGESLYSLKPDSPWAVLNYQSDIVEKDFFQKVDGAAAIVHQKLITSGLRELTDKDKSDWSIFLNSLIERSPIRIKEIQEGSCSSNLRQEFIKRWGKSDCLDKIDIEAMQKNAVITALPSFIGDVDFLSYVIKMRWVIIDLTIENEHFLTSDTPLQINAGQSGNPIHVLSIALSPKRLLIIHKDCSAFDDQFFRTVAVSHNLYLVKNTQKYVVSSCKLENGPHIKYLRVLESLLNNS
jgi:hypothetical protein